MVTKWTHEIIDAVHHVWWIAISSIWTKFCVFCDISTFLTRQRRDPRFSWCLSPYPL